MESIETQKIELILDERNGSNSIENDDHKTYPESLKKKGRSLSHPFNHGNFAENDNVTTWNDYQISFEGEVKKKGDWLPRWETIFAKINGVVFTYYTTKKQSQTEEPRSYFNIVNVEEEYAAYPMGFILHTKEGKKLYLSTDTVPEKTIWIDVLKSSLKNATSAKAVSILTTDSRRFSSPPEMKAIVNLDKFYEAYGTLFQPTHNYSILIQNIHPSIVITSNYPYQFPISGEFTGYDGLVIFFSRLKNILVSGFRLSRIAKQGNLAVIQGRETIRNKQDGRNFRESWIHELRFAKDGRISHLHIKGDAVASRVAFGNKSEAPILSLPHEKDEFSISCPPGKLKIVIIEAKNLRNPHFLRKMISSVRVSLRNLQPKGKDDDQLSKLSNVGTADIFNTATASGPNPTWTESLDIPFSGAVPGTANVLYLEVVSHDLSVGLCKINLSPYLQVSMGLQEEIASKSIPQWYKLIHPNQIASACTADCLISGQVGNKIHDSIRNRSDQIATTGELLLSITFEEEDAQVDNKGTLLHRFSFERLASLRKEHSLENTEFFENHGDTWNEIHSFKVAGTSFHIPKRYEMIKAIGHGAYGVVIAASDLKTGKSVAIKCIPRTFDDLIDARRIVREIKLMRHFNHPNIISLIDVMKPISIQEFDDTYLVTELMESDLHRVIQSCEELTDDHISYIVYQLLCAINCMHSANIIHRDIKPSNILINEDCQVKLCDLGLARVNDSSINDALTEYVVTRWYRAPELLLACKYTNSIDIWSVGCILGELIRRKALFTGHDHLHQLELIMRVLGSPSTEDMQFITNEKAKKWLLKQPIYINQSIREIYPTASSNAIDLLNKMLQFNPFKRITVEQALNHPYFKNCRDPRMETTAEPTFNSDFEALPLEKGTLQGLIYQDISFFHPEADKITTNK